MSTITIEEFARQLAAEFNLPVSQTSNEVCQGLGSMPTDPIDERHQEAFRIEYRLNGMP